MSARKYSEEEIKEFLAGGTVYPRVVACHSDLDAVCGTCKTFPKGWPAHNWKCRTRGQNVSKHTHACEKYREDQEFIAHLYGLEPPQKPEKPTALRQQIEAMHLPASPHWHYRLVEKMLDRKIVESRLPPASTPGLREHSGGVVYFIDCDRFTKIGHTSEVVAGRIKQLETSNPFPLRLWGLVKGPVDLERRFQARFYKSRYRNEWFALGPWHRAAAKRLVCLFGGEIYEDGTNA